MSRHENDAPEIKRALVDRLESVVDAYFPGAVHRAGSAYPAPKGGHDLGSFRIYLKGAKRGEWFRSSQGIGGDAINLIAYAMTGNHRDYSVAFAEAKKFLGHLPSAPRPAQAPVDDVAEELKREKRRADAFAVWRSATPVGGTIAETYLRSRGIRFDLTPYRSIRFHGAVRYDLAGEEGFGKHFPALVAAVQGPQGRFQALARVFLAETGGKAAVRVPKLSMGPFRGLGGAVRLGEVAEHVNVCEGIETGFGVLGLTHQKESVLCGAGTYGVREMQMPAIVKSATIWPDGDRMRIQATAQGDRVLQSPGMTAAEALRERLTSLGIAAKVEPIPLTGKDALDIWNAIQGHLE